MTKGISKVPLRVIFLELILDLTITAIKYEQT